MGALLCFRLKAENNEYEVGGFPVLSCRCKHYQSLLANATVLLNVFLAADPSRAGFAPTVGV